MCNAVAPSMFPLDDEGYVEIDFLDVSDADITVAQQGVDTCPERALSLEG
jgi:ferredoxin